MMELPPSGSRAHPPFSAVSEKRAERFDTLLLVET